jgi:ferric-dicitrate binding protein FerR (iron transport regulator)
MKARQLSKSLASLIGLAILFLSTSAHALTQIEGASLDALVSSGDTIVVPEGETYKLILPGGGELVVEGGSTFSLSAEGDTMRLTLTSGQALYTPPVGKPQAGIEIEIGGSVVQSTGADLVVSVTDSGVSLSQLTNEGTVTVDGTAIPKGDGGNLTDGGFVSDPAVQGQLNGTAQQIRNDAVVPMGPVAPKSMPQLPQTIVEENLNDVSPS